jgi:hypothetical protein
MAEGAMDSVSKGFRAITSLAAASLILVAVPAPAQSTDCLDMECFYDRQVRDFRVIDSNTVIVYVGGQRCPYLVTTQGFYCDLKFIPDIDFFHERQWRQMNRRERADDLSTRIFGRRGGAIGAQGIDRQDGFARNDRICENNASQYALDTFGFGPFHQDDVPIDQVECPVVSVAKITDDDLVELYTEQGMAPPPPIGNGTISRSGEEGSSPE